MEIVQQLERHLLPLTRDALRLSIWFAVLMIVFTPIEKLFAVHPHKIFRKHFAVDLVYYFLNGLLPSVLLAIPMAIIASGLRHLVPIQLTMWVIGMPLWVRAFAGLVVGEFGYYWGHRWMHEVPMLWRFHAIHHSAEEMDWLVASRAHPLDVTFGRLCSLVPMYAVGLAQPLAGRTLDLVPLIVMVVGPVWGFFVHANIRCRWEWFANVLSTPAFHHWHHRKDEPVARNYASMLPIMDRLFGTWHLPHGEWPQAYGIERPVPAGLATQIIQPFVPGIIEETPVFEIAGSEARD